MRKMVSISHPESKDNFNPFIVGLLFFNRGLLNFFTYDLQNSPFVVVPNYIPN